MIEQWKDIPNHEGRYQASNQGRIRSLLTTKILSPCLVKGYKAVGLSKNGRSKLITIHRLVLLAFVGPCPEGKETRHLDGDKLNNRLDNLKWTSHLKNMHDRYKHDGYGVGRIVSRETGEKIAASKRGKPRDAATRAKLSASLMGHTHTPEVRARMAENMKKRWAARKAAGLTTL